MKATTSGSEARLFRNGVAGDPENLICAGAHHQWYVTPVPFCDFPLHQIPCEWLGTGGSERRESIGRLGASDSKLRKPVLDSDIDRGARGRAWLDDRTVVGASDAGAHLDTIDTFAISTQVLGNGVRRHGVVSLEEGVRQLTDVPARLYGLRERGRLEVGWHADITVFDPDTIDCGPTYTRFDLPTGAGRLYADAAGIDHVFVNGVEIVQKGEHTGAFPGTILHSGRDTDTVEAPGGAS